jgi:hypothetical protein
MSTGIEALAERPVVPAVIIRGSYTSGCHVCAGVEGVSWEQGGRGGFSRAYMHPLDRCGEMLGPMLATIHNLHCHLFLMQEMRNAPDAVGFAGFVARFKGDRVRGGYEGGQGVMYLRVGVLERPFKCRSTSKRSAALIRD